MIVPLAKLPSGLASFAKLLPAEALSAALHATLGSGGAAPVESWVVLAVWAVAATVGRCAGVPLGMRARSSAMKLAGVS